MPGPQPKDPALRRRRNATPGFKLLPHEGRVGDPPAWPLGEITPQEQTVWQKLWTLPQAIEWERMRCEDTVALYVRSFVAATSSDPNPKMLAEVRQLDSKIGLSPRAMRDLKWETDEPAEELEVEEQPKTESAARAFVPK